MKILLGVTGSVAAFKAAELVKTLIAAGHEIQVVMTDKAMKFCNPWKIPADVRVWVDKDEWQDDYKVHESPVLHIELREWADIFLIAPLSANTLAKLANGLADNLLTCVARAWDRKKPFIIAPAMNTEMWLHPATDEHLGRLKRWMMQKFILIHPVVKMLACGTEGVGAMAEVETIVEAVTKQAPRQNSGQGGK